MNNFFQDSLYVMSTACKSVVRSMLLEEQNSPEIMRSFVSRNDTKNLTTRDKEFLSKHGIYFTPVKVGHDYFFGEYIHWERDSLDVLKSYVSERNTDISHITIFTNPNMPVNER